MPTQFGTATVITKRSFDVTWLTIGGDKPHTRLNEVPTAATDVQLNTLRDALGDLSNAAVLADNRTTKREIAVNEAEAFDEAYSGSNIRAVLKFQDDNLDVKELQFPAPDDSIFGPDGVTIIEPGAAGVALQLAATITAALAVLNAGGGTYAYIAGYRTPLPPGFRVRARPGSIVEALAASEPPDLPGPVEE